MDRHVFVTGGCGYKGGVLVPKLLDSGFRVTVVDTQWFGNALAAREGLTVIRADVREADGFDLRGVDAVIHLANIANDPSVDLDPTLSWEVNVLATQRLAERARACGVGSFLYASSGSVYGVRDEERVTETVELTPISVYNKTKMVAERVLLSYAEDMLVQIVRPATVCGWSPRMRLDVAVNMLTMQALARGRITVLGGAQTRPNIHVQDVCAVYLHLLDVGAAAPGVFNAGFENLTILEIAQAVAARIPTEIEVLPSNDPRSYRLCSDKLLATGFKPRFGVADAIAEIQAKVAAGELADEEAHYNLKRMKSLGVGAK